MNPKDIGKKDWEIKQEFLKSNPISQEEEKLIEEFFKEFYNYLSKTIGKITLPIDYKEFLSDHFRKAFRAGKLAGFEESFEKCKELIPEVEKIKNRKDTQEFNLKIGFNTAIMIVKIKILEGIKSLGEEEKKKL